jgi:hypothetical protein
MTSHDSKDDEGLSADIFGTTVYEPSRPPKKDFLPWHRPRKQFVRERQWLRFIQELLDEVVPMDGIVKYLGLPGVDLLDVRFIHREVCQPRNLGLRFLGFNSEIVRDSSARSELNISLDEVRKLPRVDHLSDVIPDDFRTVATKESLGWKRTEQAGPFDIVNLDLCDGIGSQNPMAARPTHYDAIWRLLALQARQKTDWLLLITTRAGRAHTDADALAKLMAGLSRNLVECDEFRSRCDTLFQVTDSESLECSCQNDLALVEFFLVGLCKWIVGSGIRQQPPSIVNVQSTIGYKVYGKAKHHDLVSIALRFKPSVEAGSDPAGLGRGLLQQPDECELAVSALGKTHERIDADKTLANDPELRRSLIASTSELLLVARYDTEAYKTWVETADA